VRRGSREARGAIASRSRRLAGAIQIDSCGGRSGACGSADAGLRGAGASSVLDRRPDGLAGATTKTCGGSPHKPDVTAGEKGVNYETAWVASGGRDTADLLRRPARTARGHFHADRHRPEQGPDAAKLAPSSRSSPCAAGSSRGAGQRTSTRRSDGGVGSPTSTARRSISRSPTHGRSHRGPAAEESIEDAGLKSPLHGTCGGRRCRRTCPPARAFSPTRCDSAFRGARRSSKVRRTARS